MRSTLDGKNVWWIQTQIRKTVFLLEEYQFCLFFSEIYSAHSGNTITMKDIEIMTHIIPRFGQNKRFGFNLLNQNTKDLDIQILLPKFLYPIWQVYQLLIRMIYINWCNRPKRFVQSQLPLAMNDHYVHIMQYTCICLTNIR